jgi:DNA polymerase-1
MFYDFARERRYDAAGVRAQMGVLPEQIPDLLGLQGDAVDNIPGVKGVGAKTALFLLQTFPTLEALYADLDRVETLPVRGAKSLRRKLDAGHHDALMSKQLATIARDAPAVYAADALVYHGAIESEVNLLWDELGFQRLRQRIPKWRTEPF